MSERARSPRWPRLLLVLAASATALFLGAALAASGDPDADTALLVAGMACFFATVVAPFVIFIVRVQEQCLRNDGGKVSQKRLLVPLDCGRPY